MFRTMKGRTRYFEGHNPKEVFSHHMMFFHAEDQWGSIAEVIMDDAVRGSFVKECQKRKKPEQIVKVKVEEKAKKRAKAVRSKARGSILSFVK